MRRLTEPRIVAGRPAALAVTGLLVVPLAALVSRRRRNAAARERDAAILAGEQQRHERRQREHELALLEEAARILASTLDVAEIERQVARSAALIWSAPDQPGWRASYLTHEAGVLRPTAEYDEPGLGIGLGHVYTLDDSPWFRTVVVDQQPVHSRVDRVAMSRFSESVTTDAGLRAMAMAPVVVDGSTVGILAMSSRDAVDVDPGQLDRLMAVAHLAELALANARRFQVERDHARRAQSLEEAKSRFLNLASHEMRGPLTVLGGYLAMAREGDFGRLDPVFTRVLGLVTGKIDELARLVDQMLETARLEDQRLALSLEDVDLRGVVERALCALGTLVTESHRVDLRLGAEPIPVRGDPERLATVVANLVDNARKYSPAGTAIRVVCRTEAGQAAVDIVDHGHGISEADQELLFTRFGRIVTRHNSHVPGTGLGLWLSREIARLHGGDITVASRAGEGSSFTLRLPRPAS